MNLLIKGMESNKSSSPRHEKIEEQQGLIPTKGVTLLEEDESATKTKNLKYRDSFSQMFKKHIRIKTRSAEAESNEFCSQSNFRSDATSSVSGSDRMKTRNEQKMLAIIAEHNPDKQRVDSWTQSVQQLLSDKCWSFY